MPPSWEQQETNGASSLIIPTFYQVTRVTHCVENGCMRVLLSRRCRDQNVERLRWPDCVWCGPKGVRQRQDSRNLHGLPQYVS